MGKSYSRNSSLLVRDMSWYLGAYTKKKPEEKKPIIFKSAAKPQSVRVSCRLSNKITLHVPIEEALLG